MATVDSFDLLYREIARSCNSYVETLALVGALYTASKAIWLLRDCCSLIRVHVLPRMIPGKRLAHRYGEWAVIYGASEVIGQAYAEELARQGVSLILVSQERAASAAIEETARAVSEAYGVRSLVVVADFSQGRAATAGKPVTDALRDKDVGFLVNCVCDDESLDGADGGCGPQNLTDQSEERLWDVLSRNVAAATLMTRLVLPGMVERRRGAVVNISSGACARPSPGRAALSGTTAYLDSFSSALRHEYGRHGIFVQSLVPLRVACRGGAWPGGAGGGAGGGGGGGGGGWLVPRPEVYARHAVSTLGVAHKTTGYWPHTLQYGLVQCVPEWIWVLGSRMLTSSS